MLCYRLGTATRPYSRSQCSHPIHHRTTLCPFRAFPQTVGFGDNLFFRRLPEDAVKDEFECNMEGVPTDGSNLVLRALDLFRERTATQDFYKVRASLLFAYTMCSIRLIVDVHLYLWGSIVLSSAHSVLRITMCNPH